ncbi:MAG TPA: thioesterase domain-containing protein [Acidimicrobiales bacterium]|nr:thioesterase domain-containing protein [Acidimicrobiales bacterium]
MTAPLPSAGQVASPWLPITRPRPTASVRLFCLPYAGAGATVFRGWSDLLPQVDVAPVQLPGREGRIGESPAVDVDELAASVLPYTDRPYAVFGHSFGARLGFELCRALRARGARPPAWLFVSGAQAPHLPQLRPPASVLPDDEFVDRVTELGGTPPEILDDPEMRALALPVLRADFAYVDRYAYEEGPPLACPITVFAGDRDGETRVDDLWAWAEHTAGAFAVRVLPGDHFFLHSARSQLVSSLAADLATGPVPTARISVPVLEPGEAHVWCARTDELALSDDRLVGMLAPDEVARAGAFRFRRDASRFVRRRWLLRRLLAAVGRDPGTEPLPTGPNGRPTALPGATLFFSASSSGGVATVALARDHDLGLDVERLRPVPDLDLLARSTMTAEEQAELARLPPGERDDAFLRLWTVKEAYLKALGAGLSLDPARVTTRVVGPGRWSVSSPDAAGACSVSAVDVGAGHVASLAVPAAVAPRVRVLSLSAGRLS